MLDKVFFKKLNKEAKAPTRANGSDAGADVYYCGNEKIEILPNRTALLGTGLQIATPHGYVCEVKNRSGMAYKNQLLVGACVIDSGYSGEVMINLHNVGSEVRVVNPGDKIAQLIFYQVGLPLFNELTEEEELYSQTDTSSNRAANGFGSTGNK